MSPSESTVRCPPDFASLGAAVGAWNCEGIAELALELLALVLLPLLPHDESTPARTMRTGTGNSSLSRLSCIL